jgi:hypothetical protein
MLLAFLPANELSLLTFLICLLGQAWPERYYFFQKGIKRLCYELHGSNRFTKHVTSFIWIFMIEEGLFRAGLAPSTSFDIECEMMEGAQDSAENVPCSRAVTRNELVMTWYVFPA